MESIIVQNKENVCKVLGSGKNKKIKDLILLVVPVVSTTLSSVKATFLGYDFSYIGNVFIDEAGQATPQAGIGVISRATRVMAVGDPFQIEPVNTLNEGVYNAIRKKRDQMKRTQSLATLFKHLQIDKMILGNL